jgi:hypothetical protein
MLPLPAMLLAASAAIPFVLGTAHLLITFRGTGLQPREAALIAQMQQAPLVLTRQTTMWRAWIGFNASHSLGAMLFGVVYAYLALLHPAFLFASTFLLGLGLLWLAVYAELARRYWFRIPLRGLLLALGLYLAALIA